MKQTEEQRRVALQAFVESYGRRKLNWICKHSGASESAVRAFLKGDTTYLTEPTYDKLAAWSKWSLSELKGEAPPPNRDDVLSRKSENGRRTVSDSSTPSEQDTHRAVGSPESEGEMADRLFIEILDRIDALPAAHVRRLKRILDRMDTKDSPDHPQKAGIAE